MVIRIGSSFKVGKNFFTQVNYLRVFEYLIFICFHFLYLNHPLPKVTNFDMSTAYRFIFAKYY